MSDLVTRAAWHRDAFGAGSARQIPTPERATGEALSEGTGSTGYQKSLRHHRTEPLDAQAAADIAKRVQAAQAEAGGRNLRTAAERLSAWRGRPHPSAWDSRSGIVLSRQWHQVEGLD
jgi:hypothetical protein